MSSYPTFRYFGEHSVLLEWRDKIDEEIHRELIQWKEFIEEIYRDEIIEIAPSYNALAVFLRPGIPKDVFIDKLRKAVVKRDLIPPKSPKLISIPVCYDDEFGIDLKALARLHQLSISEVIEIHSQKIYKTYFIGFLPGFPYLAGLDQRLHTPRKVAPRRFIEAGSVGIGSSQTGVYPGNYPGGWNIIGRTPLKLFDATRDQPSLIRAGDLIKFVPVSKTTYRLIEIEINTGTYKMEEEVYND
ncbi:MAG: 5-oxoprolinase subunit PxpB [Flavobacteriaceae bacterium]|nr:5-oxoprolinase subunit PxpB [Flavobacteriaceae bacterium]